MGVVVVGRARWKRKSDKKLSLRKRLGGEASVFAESGLKVKRVSESGFTSIGVSGEVCPLDKEPCKYGKEFIGSCDDVSSVIMGFNIREGEPCSRSVGKNFMVSKK